MKTDIVSEYIWMQDLSVKDLHEICNKTNQAFQQCKKEKDKGEVSDISSLNLTVERQVLLIDPYTKLYAILPTKRSDKVKDILFYTSKINYYEHLYTSDELKEINIKAIAELNLLRSEKDVIIAIRNHKYIVMVKSI